MDIQYYLENIETNISNYFIDNDIIVNDDDDFNTKCKKYLLKYKRFIGLICLIILIIIGYNCNPYNINYNNYNYNDKDNQIQNGGAKAAMKAQQAAAKKAAKEAKTVAKKAEKDAKSAAKAAEPSKGEKMAASGQAKMDKHKQALKDFGGKAASLSTYTNAAGSAAGAAGRAVTDNADLVFQVLYSVAIFILICIVTIPALAFIVVGIICFVLLKPKMAALKAL
jgi:hypothetical protein